MPNDSLTAEQTRDLRALAGSIIPPSATYGVPGADDEKIFNDILNSLERDRDDICRALAQLATLAGGAFADLDGHHAIEKGRVFPVCGNTWHMLHKTPASQIVDFWVYAAEIGQSLVGTDFTSFASQTSTPAFQNGLYDTKTLNLKLAVNGRAITMALANQNSFINIVDQEEASGALAILQTIEWNLYWGNPTFYPNQPLGIAGQLIASNIFDFSTYIQSPEVVSSGISAQQALFNLIYEAAGEISGFRVNGNITHALMPNTTIADLQTLVTTQLRNIVEGGSNYNQAIVPNGNLHGMRTRFGDIQFALDYFITARDVPAQAMVFDVPGGGNFASTSINAPTSVTWAVNSSVTGSGFTTAYTPSGNNYVYAVAMMDSSMNESVLTYTSVITGLAVNGGVTLTITPNGSAGAAFRVFRAGLGYNATSSQNPAAFRYIGTVAANGASAVTFQDINGYIPGSDTIFLLDLEETHDALDYRYLLPLTKIDLFTQSLTLPFVIAHIGAPRVRIPKYHGMIKNYPSGNTNFNPLQPNFNAPVII